MRDPEKDKLLANVSHLLNLFVDDSISGTENMASIRERCREIMSDEELRKAVEFLESGEASEYLHSRN